MAALTDSDRREVWAQFMRERTDALATVKADLRAAVDAIDAWVDANAASFNAAIPQPARTQLTTSQKSRLLKMIVSARFEKGV